MTALPFVWIKKRADFLRASRSGRKAVSQTLILQAAANPDTNAPVRVGLTVSKKVGNAVVRNRVKRRFRAAVRELIPVRGTPATDYVLIGRHGAGDCPFTQIVRDLQNSLNRLQPTGQKTTQA